MVEILLTKLYLIFVLAFNNGVQACWILLESVKSKTKINYPITFNSWRTCSVQITRVTESTANYSYSIASRTGTGCILYCSTDIMSGNILVFGY